MSTSEKDGFRLSLIRKACNSPELVKEVFKENFGRIDYEFMRTQQDARRIRSCLKRPKMRRVTETETDTAMYKVNDIVSIKELTTQTKRTGIICRIDEVMVGKKVKRWFRVLTVIQNRYEFLKVTEKQISRGKSSAEDKAALCYGLALHRIEGRKGPKESSNELI